MIIDLSISIFSFSQVSYGIDIYLNDHSKACKVYRNIYIVTLYINYKHTTMFYAKTVTKSPNDRFWTRIKKASHSIFNIQRATED